MAVSEQAPHELPRTLWVGDLESWMDELFLARCFEGTGQVINIKILRRSLSAASPCYAFIEFAHHAEGAALLEKAGGRPWRCAQGHSFRLNWAQFGTLGDRERAKTSVSLYVGGLDASVRESDLTKLFERYSSLSHVKVITDPTTCLSKGFGFVRFRDPADAELAQREMQGVVLGSKYLKVKPATRMEGREREGFQPLQALNSVKAICISGLEHASPEDGQQLLQRCAAFGAIRRYLFVEGSCLVEFHEWPAAEAAASHLQDQWGLPVQAVDASTASYYLQLAQVCQPAFETVPAAPSQLHPAAISNLTMAKAERALCMERAEPGLDHFKALLKDPRFVRIFEAMRQNQGAAEKHTVGMRWSWLLENKPEFFSRPSDELVQQANSDFFETYGDLRSGGSAVAPTPAELRMLCC